jgi:peroxiredoxin
VSFDALPENKAFAVDQEYPYRLLSDVDRTVGEAYGTRRPDEEQFNNMARRLSFLIDPDRRIRKIYVVRDVNAHPQEVLDDLVEMKRSQ